MKEKKEECVDKSGNIFGYTALILIKTKKTISLEVNYQITCRFLKRLYTHFIIYAEVLPKTQRPWEVYNSMG